MINAKDLIGQCDLLFIVLDSLRYDVAFDALQQGLTPNLFNILPNGWEERHSPGNFTYSAHQAFFAGFLPTPIKAGLHPRLFAVRFSGSETTNEQTCVFDSPDIVKGLFQKGYHTICIGGVGFFNKQTPLGNVLPGLFAESHWDKSLGVTEINSTENQINLAVKRLIEIPKNKRVFLFVNISAIHQPNYFYLDNKNNTSKTDSLKSHLAALKYVDSKLPLLFQTVQKRATTLVIICSDHGTAYGEDGYFGHRISHKVVFTVPYAEFILELT
jgi:hypothetical protein